MIAILQIGVFCLVIFAITKPIGVYLARVFEGERTLLTPVLSPMERGVYRAAGVDQTQEMRWTTYTVAMLLFSLISMLATFALLRLQGHLPLNPQGLGAVEPRLAFNTAASFTTNTNWQSYVPEVTMSNLSQMLGLATHNFLSAATGLGVAMALIRGFSRRSGDRIGNFWVDLTRATLYVLLPACVVITLILVARGVPQNLNGAVSATTISGVTQTIAQGPVASQEAIKMLGTNGGGFFNANSAHPYENPTPFTNFLEMLLIFAIPAGLTYTFGRMVGNQRQGWTLFSVMALLFLIGVTVATVAEQDGNPTLSAQGASAATSFDGYSAPGGNMEGKESRFGITTSSLFAVITTAASCGAVNAMHDSFTPIGGLVPLANIALGEVIFGGVGAGMYGILVYAVIAVFITGLMVGRTPEYLGKKIEPYDIKMAMLTLLVIPLTVLGFTAAASVSDWGVSSIWNPGPHGLSEMLYAFTSAAGNNGSAFAGLGANTPQYNVTLGIAMLIGRFLMIVPILALAGSLVRKKRAPESVGMFPTTGGLWVGVLTGVIVIVGALTYIPVFSLGAVIEHVQMRHGVTFGF